MSLNSADRGTRYRNNEEEVADWLASRAPAKADAPVVAAPSMGGAGAGFFSGSATASAAAASGASAAVVTGTEASTAPTAATVFPCAISIFSQEVSSVSVKGLKFLLLGAPAEKQAFLDMLRPKDRASYMATMGIDFVKRSLVINGADVDCQFWSGNHQAAPLAAGSYSNVFAALHFASIASTAPLVESGLGVVMEDARDKIASIKTIVYHHDLNPVTLENLSADAHVQVQENLQRAVLSVDKSQAVAVLGSVISSCVRAIAPDPEAATKAKAAEAEAPGGKRRCSLM